MELRARMAKMSGGVGGMMGAVGGGWWWQGHGPFRCEEA